MKENTQGQTPQPAAGETMTVIGVRNADRPPVWGIVGTVLGGASLLPLLGILSPFGLIAGIVGILRDDRHTVAIIGTALSIIGIITSPIVWAILAPPDQHSSPAAAGAYWGAVTFLVIVGAAVGWHYLKQYMDSQDKTPKS